MFKPAKHQEFILSALGSATRTMTAQAARLSEQVLLDNNLALAAIIGNEAYRNWLEDTNNFLFQNRAFTEKANGLLQPLPYLVFYKTGEDGKRRYCAYRRTKTVGEEKLAMNGSVGWGGHVELSDVVLQHNEHMEPTGVPQFAATIAKSVNREIKEELNFYTKLPDGGEGGNDFMVSGFTPNYVLLDRLNEVGRVHIGLVCLIPLPEDFEYRVGQPDEHVDLGLMTAEELLNGDIELENWTQMVLQLELNEFGQREPVHGKRHQLFITSPTTGKLTFSEPGFDYESFV
jgi:predicted NUDIX family phosphoesterase